MKSVYTLLIALMCAYNCSAFQSKDLLIAQIDDLEIRSKELLYAFNKNRDNSESLNADSLKAYLDNYINFKLKVLEARKQGYDTVSTFREELAGYISQIRKPYLENPEAEERLVKETYQKMLLEINASHILVRVKPNALPEDTLKAYLFADSLRYLVDSKEDFETLAKNYSEDGAAPNGGKLGWFSAMDMVGPFEDAAYQTSEGQVSEIVRTQFGYHLIYINQKRPSRGKLKTSHIFFSSQGRTEEQAMQLARSVYDSLENGADWDKMARKYSDDSRTKMNGGQLPWARIKQLPDDFFDYAYALKEINKYSPPRKTRFGWHIIKLDDEQPIKPLSQLRTEIVQQLKQSGRNSLDNDQLIAKLKQENNFVSDEARVQNFLKQISKEKPEADARGVTLFTIGQKTVRADAFVKTLPSQQISLNYEIIISLYREFERKTILAYEDSIAPVKYPEYGFLMKEYEEGLLLFEIMQNEVWNKAMADSTGTEMFYKDHLTNYQSGKRFITSLVTGASESMIEKLKASNQRGLPLAQLVNNNLTEPERSLLKIVKRTIKANEIPSFDSTELESGTWVKNPETSEYYFIESIIPAGPQPYEEIKGRVLSDYQDYLESEWIKELRNSRKVKVYLAAIEKIQSH